MLQTYRSIKIADNPVQTAHGVVIDHRLREGSTKEAALVCSELKKLGIKSFVRTLNWKQLKRQGLDPNELSNMESHARTLRYQALGNACRYLQATSLFFAHHRDDQYETVLMRLLAGHGYRGLQGIRDANAIPECYELHGVYKSGLLDDQKRKHPSLSFRPPVREIKGLRWALKNAKEAEPWEQIDSYLNLQEALSQQFPRDQAAHKPPSSVPYLAPLDSEEGGVMVYRPLLQFDKDRLMATCEANNVPWFEDHTNADSSLTPRNAIRHLVQTHELPRALQKPAILALSRRARTRSLLEAAEAHRMLIRERVIKHFDPNAGTLLIEPPTLETKPTKRGRRLNKARDEARRPLRRLLAAIAIQKMIGFVTPDRHLPPLANLENAVDRLFPGLSSPAEAGSERLPPKAFPMAGVLFDPKPGSGSLQWFLSRAPYPSNQPLPQRNMPGYLNYRHGVFRLRGDDDQAGRYGHWRSWKTAKIWDGRFWIRVSGCVAARFQVLPFMPAYSKPFRTALPRKDRDRLEQILKHYAPGKARYSLPALYSVEASGAGEPVLTLLALPSLGIHVPGLERWVKYEARYKQIDSSLLGPARKNKPLSRWCGVSRRLRNHRARVHRRQSRRKRNHTLSRRARRARKPLASDIDNQIKPITQTAMQQD
ncbi:putative tRNA(Ile)-lysidine synthase [Escovopsis weberi]|uniref:tRNA(Ile)-lysidine synthetase n=1 Tax=Escovopsis weberi TaxID=150374 RepID=A0A0M8MYH5_ESCWE|nr:putative tRNA(Ile)-lysidine synthase [Escovopsis weberi]